MSYSQEFHILGIICSFDVGVGKIELNFLKMGIEINYEMMISFQYIIFDFVKLGAGQIKPSQS